MPDLDVFRGSFGRKTVIPLFRDTDGTRPNLLPGLRRQLGEAFGREAVTAEAFAAYLYAILAHPGYQATFAAELTHGAPRVPLTADPTLWEEAVGIGRRLLWLHTYGERMVPEGATPGEVPAGEARVLEAISGGAYPETFAWEAGRLTVGAGTVAPVSQEVWEFSVSGLKVVQSWLGYRMRVRKGRKSSPLDDIGPAAWTQEMTRELLELLWVLEATVAGYPEQEALLGRVLAGPLLRASELPPVPEAARTASGVVGGVAGGSGEEEASYGGLFGG